MILPVVIFGGAFAFAAAKFAQGNSAHGNSNQGNSAHGNSAVIFGGEVKLTHSEAIIEELYKNWLRIIALEKKIQNSIASYQLHNIVERYLILKLNSGAVVAEKQLRKELLESRIRFSANEIINYTKMPVKSGPPEGFTIGRKITYKDFSFKISEERLHILESYNHPFQILIAALKYAALLPRGQQWAIPLERYREFVSLGYTIEAFASPFNSQIVRISPEYKYCSLFSSDKYLGSIGNFFDTNFNNSRVVVNPPFVENLLGRAAAKCIGELTKGKCSFIFYGPDWNTADYHSALSNCKWLTRTELLKINEHEYQDLFSGKTIGAKFKSRVWYLSSEG